MQATPMLKCKGAETKHLLPIVAQISQRNLYKFRGRPTPHTSTAVIVPVLEIFWIQCQGSLMRQRHSMCDCVCAHRYVCASAQPLHCAMAGLAWKSGMVMGVREGDPAVVVFANLDF